MGTDDLNEMKIQSMYKIEKKMSLERITMA